VVDGLALARRERWSAHQDEGGDSRGMGMVDGSVRADTLIGHLLEPKALI
jgi:hypothetical protein